MPDQHDFCRMTLKLTREEAKEKGVQIPKKITALRTGAVTRTHWFIEAEGVKGEFYYGDCAFEAKMKYIRDLIDKTEEVES